MDVTSKLKYIALALFAIALVSCEEMAPLRPNTSLSPPEIFFGEWGAPRLERWRFHSGKVEKYSPGSMYDERGGYQQQFGTERYDEGSKTYILNGDRFKKVDDGIVVTYRYAYDPVTLKKCSSYTGETTLSPPPRLQGKWSRADGYSELVLEISSNDISIDVPAGYAGLSDFSLKGTAVNGVFLDETTKDRGDELDYDVNETECGAYMYSHSFNLGSDGKLSYEMDIGLGDYDSTRLNTRVKLTRQQ